MYLFSLFKHDIMHIYFCGATTCYAASNIKKTHLRRYDLRHLSIEDRTTLQLVYDIVVHQDNDNDMPSHNHHIIKVCLPCLPCDKLHTKSHFLAMTPQVPLVKL